jgi:hypothetical protein
MKTKPLPFVIIAIILIGSPLAVLLIDQYSFALATLAIFPALITTVIVCIWFVALPRIKMDRRAKALLVQMPEHDSTTIYLAFASALPWEKHAAMESKIAEMERNGWVFLKASESGPLKTISSWGGGLDLQFIKSLAKSPAADV